MSIAHSLVVTSLDHLKEITKDQATICFIKVGLPNFEPFKDYKLVWYNKGKKEFYITNFNPYAERFEDIQEELTIDEDEISCKTGFLQAIKRGNFYVE